MAIFNSYVKLPEGNPSCEGVDPLISSWNSWINRINASSLISTASNPDPQLQLSAPHLALMPRPKGNSSTFGVLAESPNNPWRGKLFRPPESVGSDQTTMNSLTCEAGPWELAETKGCCMIFKLWTNFFHWQDSNWIRLYILAELCAWKSQWNDYFFQDFQGQIWCNGCTHL